MRAVLYSARDLEPITVIELPDWAVEMLRRHDRIALNVAEPLTAGALFDPSTLRFRVVKIWAEQLRMGHNKTLMVFTNDDETALLLEAAFLPGQQRDVRARVDDARARGFWHALHALAAARRGRG